MKVLLERYVPKIESPTAQPGSVPLAAMKCAEVRLRRANQAPKPTTAAR